MIYTIQATFLYIYCLFLYLHSYKYYVCRDNICLCPYDLKLNTFIATFNFTFRFYRLTKHPQKSYKGSCVESYFYMSLHGDGEGCGFMLQWQPSLTGWHELQPHVEQCSKMGRVFEDSSRVPPPLMLDSFSRHSLESPPLPAPGSMWRRITWDGRLGRKIDGGGRKGRSGACCPTVVLPKIFCTTLSTIDENLVDFFKASFIRSPPPPIKAPTWPRDTQVHSYVTVGGEGSGQKCVEHLGYKMQVKAAFVLSFELQLKAEIWRTFTNQFHNFLTQSLIKYLFASRNSKLRPLSFCHLQDESCWIETSSEISCGLWVNFGKRRREGVTSELQFLEKRHIARHQTSQLGSAVTAANPDDATGQPLADFYSYCLYFY